MVSTACLAEAFTGWVWGFTGWVRHFTGSVRHFTGWVRHFVNWVRHFTSYVRHFTKSIYRERCGVRWHRDIFRQNLQNGQNLTDHHRLPILFIL